MEVIHARCAGLDVHEETVVGVGTDRTGREGEAGDAHVCLLAHHLLARKGGWLKTALVQSAWTVVRTRKGPFYAKYVRIKSRRGGKKAVVAVAASILTAACHMIQRGTEFEDHGVDYYMQRTRGERAHHLVRRLQRLGYEVQLRTAA